jgi:4a-hydroxytetrahydrobiopterin dehydratase
MGRLTDPDIADRLTASEWTRRGDEIVRELQFADFATAVAFVDRVAAAAEEANHHPDILIHGYKHVRLTLSTHSEGGLTDADFALAQRIDGLQEAQ